MKQMARTIRPWNQHTLFNGQFKQIPAAFKHFGLCGDHLAEGKDYSTVSTPVAFHYSYTCNISLYFTERHMQRA